MNSANKAEREKERASNSSASSSIIYHWANFSQQSARACSFTLINSKSDVQSSRLNRGPPRLLCARNKCFALSLSGSARESKRDRRTSDSSLGMRKTAMFTTSLPRRNKTAQFESGALINRWLLRFYPVNFASAMSESCLELLSIKLNGRAAEREKICILCTQELN